MPAKPDADNVDEHLRDLHERLRDNREVAPPVERGWIEKAGGKKRPIGQPGFEDQIVQRAVVMIVEASCDHDCQEGAHGFRKGQSPHQALHAWREHGRKRNINGRVEAEVSGLFDTLDHGHLRACSKQRVKDGGIRRLIGTWLKAGGREAGTRTSPAKGTPQGGVAAPL